MYQPLMFPFHPSLVMKNKGNFVKQILHTNPSIG